MFPKKKRVTKDLFQAIMKHGKILPSSFFVFRYIKQNNPQYAFVAPKSVAKSATERNKLRRLGYNALSLYPISSCAGIFFYKKEAKKASLAEIRLDIKVILDKAHIPYIK